MDSKIVNCNACEEDFVLDKSCFRNGWVDSKYRVRKDFFVCPHCKHDYIFKITDRELRDEIVIIENLRKEYKKLYTKKNPDNVEYLEGLLRNIEDKQKQIHDRMEELKAEWL